jgi:cytosine/uracil/thiamine/allantoin permease
MWRKNGSSGLITFVIFCGVKALLEFKGPTKINHLSEFIVKSISRLKSNTLTFFLLVLLPFRRKLQHELVSVICSHRSEKTTTNVCPYVDNLN